MEARQADREVGHYCVRVGTGRQGGDDQNGPLDSELPQPTPLLHRGDSPGLGQLGLERLHHAVYPEAVGVCLGHGDHAHVATSRFPHAPVVPAHGPGLYLYPGAGAPVRRRYPVR